MRRSARAALLLSAVALAVAANVRDVKAGCSPAPPFSAASESIVCDAATPPDPSGPFNFGGGNDTVTVNSGTYIGPFTFPSGSNTLLFGVGGGAPVLNGAVTFAGTGSNTMQVDSGIITGAVTQGSGIDSFTMTGGQIQSLAQGDGADHFFMSGGTIVGAFTDGDIAQMTGGTIGSVNMDLGNNLFNMSGGAILGNLVTGFQNDTIVVSGGSIGGNISVSGGEDSVTVTGGAVGGDVLTSTGNDAFTWAGGGTIAGRVDMGAGNDTASLSNLTSANLGATQLFDGGTGQDSIQLSNVEAAGISRFVNWESMGISNGSRVTFDGNLVMGDAGTGTGAVSIDRSSTILAGNGVNPSILPFAGGNLVTVTNAGLIDLTPGGASPADSLTIVGNYIGAGGTVAMNTVLGTDGSPSDKLVISGGTASGTTGLRIANAGGAGAVTVADGIQVVDAINGATTDDAFRLAGPAVAGPFEYTLFKGDGNPEAWYLRSTVPTDNPNPCPFPRPVNRPPGAPEPPVLPPGQAVNFRPEVSLYAAVPNISLTYGRKLVETLHQNVGEETEADRDPAMGPHGAWGRVVGQRGSRDGGCPVLTGPGFDYGFAALQAGFDALRARHRDGSRDRAGVYVAFGDGYSDVTHAGANSNVFAGRDTFSAYSMAAYWTHYGAWGWYLGSVLQGTWYDVDAQSTRIPALETNGWGYAASLEAGVPFKGLFPGSALLGGLTVEPQAQLVYQAIDLDDGSDAGGQVRFDNVESLAGRLGVRFATGWTMPGTLGLGPAPATVWFRPSYWHEFSDNARALFSSVYGFLPFPSNIADNWVELNVGLTVQVDRGTALFASGSYDTATDGNGEAWDGRIGLKVAW